MTGHQIIHGDACEVLPTLDVKANLILTSPPYDNLRDYGGHGFDFDRMADVCVGALAEGGVIVWVVADATVDGSETGTSFRQALGFMERGLRLHDTMIYEVSVLKNPTPNRYPQAHEYMFVFSNGSPTTSNLLRDRANVTAGDKYEYLDPTGRSKAGNRNVKKASLVTSEYGLRSNIWRYPVGYQHSAPDFLAAHDHPAIFPLALAKDHITTWTNPGDLVLDPMAGSGTVNRAAKDLGRDSIAIEIHVPYIGLIRRRMAQEVMELA